MIRAIERHGERVGAVMRGGIVVKAHKAVCGLIMFQCPGCKCCHGPRVDSSDGRSGPIWGWNGSLDAPTFTPSILVKGVVPLTDDEIDRIMRGEKVDPVPMVCHSFVTDGKIQFLSDSTHELAGQTVEIPEWD